MSRGALKLIAGLDAFGIDATGACALDIGASTGGFTDVLLRRGARRVYAIDVGYGQLAWSLRQDPRVVVLERQNIRALPLELVPEPCDVAVIDVSFISLTLVLPRVAELPGRASMSPGREPAGKPIVALVSRSSRPGATTSSEAASFATRRRGGRRSTRCGAGRSRTTSRRWARSSRRSPAPQATSSICCSYERLPNRTNVRILGR